MPEPCTAVVVDDDPAIQILLARALGEIGLTATAFYEGETAIAWLDRQPGVPAVITVDLMMPGMSGFTLVRLLRARPRFTRVPIVVATARAQLHDAAEAGKLGCTFLTKPFRLRELIVTVERLVEWSRPVERYPAR